MDIENFFKLYIDDYAYKSNSFGVIMIILYANVFFYVLDLYNLVKRKSQVETIAIMSIPVSLSVIASAIIVLTVRVPNPGDLDSFVEVLANPEICRQLVLIAGIYAILWMITYFSQKKRTRKDIRKWIISCVPDYCCALGIILGTVCRFGVGIHFFTIYNQIFLWLYVSCVFFLSCKVVILAVGNLVRLYSMKITIFKWTEKKNPALFLTGYFYFCQSAILRNAVLFEASILYGLTTAIDDSGWTEDLVFIMIVLYLGAVLAVAVSIYPAQKGLNQFLEWGGAEKSKRMFCQEYFLEEALYKDNNFTVTRHFLIAEQYPADVYYWPYLRNISGEIIGKEGKCRELVFSDGKVYRFTPEEMVESGKILQYAQRYVKR